MQNPCKWLIQYIGSKQDLLMEPCLYFPMPGSDLQPKDAMIWITASLWANSGVFRLIYKHHQSLSLKWANNKPQIEEPPTLFD